jgi:hypothetical protein
MTQGCVTGAEPIDRPSEPAQVMRLAVLLDDVQEPDWVTAGLCGIDPSSLSRYKTGSRPIPSKHAEALAAHLGVSVEDVNGRAGEEWLAELGRRVRA